MLWKRSGRTDGGAEAQAVPVWPMLVGVAAAWFVLDSLVPWLHRGSLPRMGLVIIALSLMFIAAFVSGTVVRGIYARWFKAQRVAMPVVRAACVAALWVPAWVLYMETWSLLMIAAGAICLACLGFFLKRCQMETLTEMPVAAPVQHGTPFLFEEGLLARRLAPSLALVLLLDAVIVLAATRWFVTASVAAGVFAGVLAWRAVARGVRGDQVGPVLPPLRQGTIAVAAFVFTVIALIPYLRVGPKSGDALPFGAAKKAEPVAAKRTSNEGYVGVILLPLAEMQKRIEAPPLRHDLTPHFGVKIAEPFEIPFDGQYWYFKWPEKRPRPTARVVKGSSTKTQVSSSDRYPLTMEAHQKLVKPLDLGCCSAMQLVVENADQLSGAISLELWVKKQLDPKAGAKVRINAVAPEAAPHYLGTMVIPSSELPVAQRPNASGKALEETVRFPIPAAMDGVQFDEIMVVMRTAPERGRMGAKVALKKFVLEP
jgi:hypothetical protein